MVQSLECVQPNSSASPIRDAVELLKHATAEGVSLGDAWYYRSLLERKLGNVCLADYSLEKACQNDSEALQQQLNPFTLSTNASVKPAGRIRENWALVVGIGKFRDPSIPPLPFTAADATGFAQALLNANVGRFKSSNVAVLHRSSGHNTQHPREAPLAASFGPTRRSRRYLRRCPRLFARPRHLRR